MTPPPRSVRVKLSSKRVYVKIMDLRQMDIQTEEKFSLIQLANMELFYWSIRTWGKWGGIVILASSEHHFIREHENLFSHPSNNVSIT